VSGNKYFRGGRYELAIKCYSEAIDLCPKDQPLDLATFHQNRAAAYDQMEVRCHPPLRTSPSFFKAGNIISIFLQVTPIHILKEVMCW
jgi:tetratricopeptide (TPR) repeat protein